MNSSIPSALPSMLRHPCCLKYLMLISFFCMFFYYLAHILLHTYLKWDTEKRKKQERFEFCSPLSLSCSWPNFLLQQIHKQAFLKKVNKSRPSNPFLFQALIFILPSKCWGCVLGLSAGINLLAVIFSFNACKYFSKHFHFPHYFNCTGELPSYCPTFVTSFNCFWLSTLSREYL